MSFEDGKTRMSVTLPTLREQEILDCPPLLPILMLEAITYSTNQYAVQYSEILYRSDIFKFTF